MFLAIFKYSREPVYRKLFRIYATRILVWPFAFLLLAGAILNVGFQRLLMSGISSSRINLSFDVYVFASAFDFFDIIFIIGLAHFFAQSRRDHVFHDFAMTGMPWDQILVPLFDLLFSVWFCGALVSAVGEIWAGDVTFLTQRILSFVESVLIGLFASWSTASLIILMNERRLNAFFQIIIVTSISYLLELGYLFGLGWPGYNYDPHYCPEWFRHMFIALSWPQTAGTLRDQLMSECYFESSQAVFLTAFLGFAGAFLSSLALRNGPRLAHD